MNLKFPRNSALTSAVFALVALSCGQSSDVSSEASATSRESVPVGVSSEAGAVIGDEENALLPDIDTTGTVFDIAEQFADCPPGPDPSTPGLVIEVSPVELELPITEQWLTIESIGEIVFDPTWPLSPRRVETRDFADGSQGPSLMWLNDSVVPAAQWALSQEGATVLVPAVYGPVENPSALSLFISLPGRDLFAAGGCANEAVNQHFVELYGSESASILNELPGKLGDDLIEHLRLQYHEESPPTEVLLNPADVSSAYLNSLYSVVLALSSDESFGDAPVCPRSTAGWNDCFYPSDYSTDDFTIAAYVEEDGILELWEMNFEVDVSNPVRLIRTIDVPVLELGKDDAAIRLSFAEREVEVLAIERLSELDVASNLWRPLEPRPLSDADLADDLP